MSFLSFSYMKVYCVFSLESPHRGDSNEYPNILLSIQNRKSPKIYTNYNIVCNYGIFVSDSRTQFEIAGGKRSSAFEPLTFYCMFIPSEPATFAQRLPMGVWNTLGSRCTNVAGSL